MKSTALLVTAFATTLATATLAAQANGVVFNTPVTYTEPVTYAAGVTYLAPVTYSTAADHSAQQLAAANPVVLERLIVTPARIYAEHEWNARFTNEPSLAKLFAVTNEQRGKTRARFSWRSLLSLQ
jgi:hypothetical protein